jgi:hypothetical protein
MMLDKNNYLVLVWGSSKIVGFSHELLMYLRMMNMILEA